jgi:hypothetical protein
MWEEKKMLLLLSIDLLIFCFQSTSEIAEKLISPIIISETTLILTQKPHMHAGSYYTQITTDCAF